MTCSVCGAVMSGPAQFCRQCGTRLVAPVGYGAEPVLGLDALRRQRVRQNLQPMGIAWCLYGVYKLIAPLIAFTAMHRFLGSRDWEFGSHWGFHAFWPVIVLGVLSTSAVCLLTGWGLATRRGWARPLGMVLGIVSLFSFPIGTALGIYTLWVLGPKSSAAEFERIAAGVA